VSASSSSFSPRIGASCRRPAFFPENVEESRPRAFWPCTDHARIGLEEDERG
jgi:hypothetical protein